MKKGNRLTLLIKILISTAIMKISMKLVQEKIKIEVGYSSVMKPLAPQA